MKYIISLHDSTSYSVEADSKEAAIEQALEWWDERQPEISIEDGKNEKDR